jgi:thiamine biosynthesis lipoprotein
MPRPEWAFEAIGTQWLLDSATPFEAPERRRVTEAVDSFDQAWSRFRPDSFVSEVARHPGTYPLPEHGAEMLAFYHSLYEVTEGAVTPLVGSALVQLGYDADYTLSPRGGAIAPPSWGDVMELDGDVLVVHEPVLLDVGAAGKGRLVDIVSDLLRDAGHDDFTVDASGDIRTIGGDPLRVGLEHPQNPSQAIGIAVLADAAICASATNRRAWGTGLHHVLDGRTGEPTLDVTATWAVASTAMLADGLATALFFADPHELRRHFDFQHVRVFAGGQVDWSGDFDGEVFQ